MFLYVGYNVGPSMYSPDIWRCQNTTSKRRTIFWKEQLWICIQFLASYWICSHGNCKLLSNTSQHMLHHNSSNGCSQGKSIIKITLILSNFNSQFILIYFIWKSDWNIDIVLIHLYTFVLCLKIRASSREYYEYFQLYQLFNWVKRW